MSQEQELHKYGATAVDAGAIEAEVLAKAQEEGAAPAPELAGDDPAHLQQQLRAVQRELRTVSAAVAGFQPQEQQDEEAQQLQRDGQEAEGRQAPEPQLPSAAAVAGGALQQAVMQQRLAGLQARRQQLEESLEQLGIAPAAVATNTAGPGPSSQAAAEAAAAGSRPGGSRKQQQQSAAGGGGSRQAAGSKKKGKQKVQFELADHDIFLDAEEQAGGGGGDGGGGSGGEAASVGLVETERDRLIRLGILTPFDRLDGFERKIERGPRRGAGAGGAAPSPRGVSTQQQAGAAAGSARSAASLDQHESILRVGEAVRAAKAARPTAILMDHTDLPRPDRPTRRIDEAFWRASSSGKIVPVKKTRLRTLAPAKRKRLASGGGGSKRRRRSSGGGGGAVGGGGSASEGSESEYNDSEAEDDVVDLVSASEAESAEDLGGEFDDADAGVFEERRATFLRRQGRHRRRLHKAAAGGDGSSDRQHQQQEHAADADVDLQDDLSAEGGGEPDSEAAVEGEEEAEDVVFEGGFRLPVDVYDRLFDYQQTAVKWMWELHTQRAGGIIGDEMGLGKTIQVIAFLAGLHHSGLFRPSLIICPATVLRQWLRELRAWWPLFRVALLHDSARSGTAGGGRPSRQRLIRDIGRSDCGILLTTYETMRLQRAELLEVEWGYVVLDEGHKIRNPDAEATLAAKQMQTVHRLIMSGSPIQNRLTELWSLFDFVFPGKLGTLPVFTAQFALPIQIGGYSNASPLQVSTAYKCAVILRDLIAPYLLRRRKADVQTQLPQKTEQVLFCTLTPEQRTLYRGYLSSKELIEIFAGSRKALAGIDILRKICNHPDLLERAKWEAAEDYGNPQRSGKMHVLSKVLEHWHQQGHKALVFTQTQQMLDIIEKHATARGYTYHRMDGSTSIAMRARLIDDFNTNENVFCFLLTTRVGGLGVNLTGANRVLLYDPDWNPSTDVQARERAWRIGQKREVVIYRLITSGTIEEKVYHRQVYKHFLTDRVLRDPRQRRFFKAKDLTDLFTLGDEYADGTETASLFASLGTEVLPDEEDPAAAAEGQQDGAAAQHDSDRDDYSSEDDHDGGSMQQQQQGQDQQQEQEQQQRVRQQQGATPNGRLRRRSSGGADLPAAAGVRAEALPAAAQQQEDGGGVDGAGQKGDAKILRELFEGSGVRGAIDHSKVEGANDSERRAADHDAARIARRAAEALRQSRLQCQQAPINQPTWTGRSGAAGLPGAAGGGGGGQRFGRAANPRLHAAEQQQESAAAAAVAAVGAGLRRFGSGGTAGGIGSGGGVGGIGGSSAGGGGGAGPGLLAGTTGGVAPRSSEILARLRERQAAVASAAAAAAADPAVEQAQLLAAQIASFIDAHGGAAGSNELVAHFQATVGAGQLPVFRGVLKQVAQLQRRPGGGGGKVWVLKPDFAGGGGDAG